MFTHINTGTTATENSINVPIFWEMTNGDMAKAISEEIKLQDILISANGQAEVETFLKTLQNDSQRIFIAYPDTCPDAMICSFGFKK